MEDRNVVSLKFINLLKEHIQDDHDNHANSVRAFQNKKNMYNGRMLCSSKYFRHCK